MAIDVTIRIRNLSIALEAISRINGATTAYLTIENLLLQEIKEFQKEKEKETQWPPRARPAPTTPNPEDEIPF